MRLVLAAALALSLAACGSDPAGIRLGLQNDGFDAPPAGCQHAAAAPFRIERDGENMVFVEVGTEARRSIVWPFGFAAWLERGVAVLYASDGSVVGREGDVLENIGGAAIAGEGFHVCAVGVRTYT